MASRLGLREGWHCLDVGAGAGSLVEEFAERVGPNGYVLAIDLDPRYLNAINLPQVEVRKANVLVDPLPENAFDLVHARLLLEHLPQHREALRRMMGAVRPGGWLLVEDLDWTMAAISYPPSELHAKVITAMQQFMAKVGYDSIYGRKLLLEVSALGLEEVSAEFFGSQLPGDPSQGWPPWELMLAQFKKPLLASGALQEQEITDWLRLSRDPSICCMSPAMFSVAGRKPS